MPITAHVDVLRAIKARWINTYYYIYININISITCVPYREAK